MGHMARLPIALSKNRREAWIPPYDDWAKEAPGAARPRRKPTRTTCPGLGSGDIRHPSWVSVSFTRTDGRAHNTLPEMIGVARAMTLDQPVIVALI
ncbi:unnamed protein product [Effrenium voratum]|nr:unnamed protein product [Effrenium voratum]